MDIGISYISINIRIGISYMDMGKSVSAELWQNYMDISRQYEDAKMSVSYGIGIGWAQISSYHTKYHPTLMNHCRLKLNI